MTKRLRVFELMPSSACEFWLEDRDAFIDAWRRIHYVSQAVVEAGKSWAEPHADDSHSALVVEDLINPSEYVSLTLNPSVTAALRLSDGRVKISNGPEEATLIDPTGRTLAELSALVRRYMERYLGEERQSSVPAPDLPEHPVATGEPLDVGAEAATVDDLYAITATMLGRFVDATSDWAVDGEHELVPRVWPHHFDLASLLVVSRDETGGMARTVGVGLTPPDSVESSGYWYVSPWSKQDAGVEFTKPELPIGRWEDRGSVAMAVLPVTEVAALSSMPGEEFGTDRSALQACAIAEFVAAAFNACMDHFEKA